MLRQVFLRLARCRTSSPRLAAGAGHYLALLNHVAQVILAAVLCVMQFRPLQHPQEFRLLGLEVLQAPDSTAHRWSPWRTGLKGYGELVFVRWGRVAGSRLSGPGRGPDLLLRPLNRRRSNSFRAAGAARPFRMHPAQAMDKQIKLTGVIADQPDIRPHALAD